MDTQYSFYTIIADAYIYKGSEERTEVNTECWSNLFSNVTVNTTQFPVIVDSGTLLLYLPTGRSMPSTIPGLSHYRYQVPVYLESWTIQDTKIIGPYENQY